MVNTVASWPTRASDGEVPWTPFAKKLSESKMAVVTTAGLHMDGQEPFDVLAGKGDPSFRAFSSDFDKADLRIAHAHYSHARAEKDINVILPIDAMRQLVEQGVLGGLAPNFYSFGFGGGITKEYIEPPDGTAHQLADRLKEDQADFVLLVPA